MAKNPDCVISDSVLCRFIDKDCSECHITRTKGDDDRKKALADFEVTISLLPPDIDEVQGDECQFCKENPRKRYRYALVDLGNSEPKSETGMFFGIGKKIRRRIGSLMPMSISICRDCRRAFILSDIIKWIVALALVAVAVGILVIPSIGSSLNQGISLLILAAVALLGYLLGKAASAGYVKSKSGRVRFNVFEIPVLKKMQDLGWFVVQDDSPVTRLIFSRKSQMRKMEDMIAQDGKDAAV
jgi:hypothetical protein